MSVKIILFGKLADIAGSSVSVNGVRDTDGLINAMHKNYPALANIEYLIAVDKQVIKENTSLNDNSIVALLPPFSGG
jgi:sulfur-carrier protein